MGFRVYRSDTRHFSFPRALVWEWLSWATSLWGFCAVFPFEKDVNPRLDWCTLAVNPYLLSIEE